jgi:4,5-dihydroxyphthalate decarboxylase
MATAPLTLRAVLGDYPHTLPLKRGEIVSPSIRLAFEDIKPISRAFKPMVREQRFDVSELALVTFFQAKAYGKPLVLLPAVMLGRFQHGCMLYNAERGKLAPADLPGRRIGVRAYSQTTGVWLRGILQQEYGVDCRTMKWITFEDAHVAEYRDPEWAERAPEGKNLTDMLLAGEIDAAIYGAEMPDDPRLQSVIPDPDAAARDWYRKHGVVPVNHLVTVTGKLAQDHPEAVAEIMRMLTDGKKAAGPKGQPDTIPFGFDVIGPSIAMLLEFSIQQGLLPGNLSVADVIRGT